MKNIIRHQHGFSMVEILVAFGLLSVLTLGLMKLFENSTKTSKDIQSKDEINQLNQELTMILSNPTNCEANLGGRRISINDPIDPFQMGGVQTFLNGESRTIHNVGTNRTEMDRRQRTTIALAEITNVDFNSSQGNNAIIDLEVTYEKPGVVFETQGGPSVNNNRIGSQTVKRIIKIGASLCPRTLHIRADQNLCPTGSNLVEGPTQILINGQSQVWGVCETCTDASGAQVTPNSHIVSCNSIAAGGGGVNLDNLSATLCLRQGGTINPDGTCTRPNNTPALTPRDQCTQLGGTWNPNSAPPRCDGLAANNTPALTPREQCTQLGGTWNPNSTPPSCGNLSDLTQIQTQMNELRTSLNEQCQNFGGTSINGKCDMKLHGGKTIKDCLDSFGQVIKVQNASSIVKICRFDLDTCPQNWIQLENWSTTVPKTCYSSVSVEENISDGEHLFNCLQFANSTSGSTNNFASINTTSSHNWGNKVPEYIIYFRRLCVYNDIVPDQNDCSDFKNKTNLSHSLCYKTNEFRIAGLETNTCISQVRQVGCY